MSDPRTRQFFNLMSRTYDRDLSEIGWKPMDVVRDWPFIVMPKQTVLDAGCGTGLVLEWFAGADRTLVGFDLSPDMISEALSRSTLRETELFVHSVDEPWPIADNSIDRIVCIAVLEFVEHLDRVFDEIARVLVPGGRALISVEDIVDAGGVTREPFELRYDELPLWRRTQDDVEMALPPTLQAVRYERQPGYEVEEQDFTCTYLFAELVLEG